MFRNHSVRASGFPQLSFDRTRCVR